MGAGPRGLRPFPRDASGSGARGGPDRRSVVSVPVSLSTVHGKPRWPVSVVVVVVVIGVLGLVPAAWASYSGAAGALAFQRSSAYAIENDNGVASQNFSLALEAPAGGPFGTALSCQAFDGDFGGHGDQYCPQSAPSFSPDGHSLAFSGVMYHSDRSALPSQSGCPNGGPCRQTIVVAAADGSAPRLLMLPLVGARATGVPAERSAAHLRGGGHRWDPR